MRRVLLGFGALVLALFMLACGGSDASDDGDASDREGDSPSSDGGQSSGPVDDGDLSYLTVTPVGLSRIAAESGDETPLATAEDLGLPPGQALQLARLIDGRLWGAVGPGHLVAIDPASGDVEQDLEFGSTQTITDFGFAGGLVWVQAGFAFADAIILGVDRSSGDLVFNVEPPAGTTIGGLAVGDEGVWVIGGDPETVSAVSRIDTGRGTVTGTFDVGLVAQQIAVGAGSVWVGGNQFAFEGKEGDGVARLDAETGEVIATIEIGETLGDIIEYGGAIWVSDASGPEFSGAQLHRIDPVTNEITDTIEVGAASAGSLDLIAGQGYVLAINSADDQTYVINAETAEGESVITGPTRPVALP